MKDLCQFGKEEDMWRTSQVDMTLILFLFTDSSVFWFLIRCLFHETQISVKPAAVSYTYMLWSLWLSRSQQALFKKFKHRSLSQEAAVKSCAGLREDTDQPLPTSHHCLFTVKAAITLCLKVPIIGPEMCVWSYLVALLICSVMLTIVYRWWEKSAWRGFEKKKLCVEKKRKKWRQIVCLVL